MKESLKALYSKEAEMAALGCMFLDPMTAAEGCGVLFEDDFYNPAYRSIFAAMRQLDVVDIVTVSAELGRRGEMEKIGISMLAEITTSISSSIHFREYTKELKRLAYYRRCLRFGREITQAAMQQNGSEVERILTAIRDDGYGEERVRTLAEATAEYITEVAEVRASGKKIIGLPTGFKDLDAMLGGLRDGELTILAARPSMGKSALAMDIARNAQKALHADMDRVVFFSLEMPRKALGCRGYTAEYQLDNGAFAIGSNDADWMNLLQDVEKNSADFEKGAGRMLLNDKSGMSVEDIRAACHGYRAQGIHLRLVVIDYLQLIACKGENRTREIGEISRGLKQMAKDLGCPFLVLSQLNRGNEGRADKRPALSDLRDGGDLEQDADTVLFIYRDEYYFRDSERKGVAEIIIGKQRNGPIGTIDLAWLAKSTTFRNFVDFYKTHESLPEEWE